MLHPFIQCNFILELNTIFFSVVMSCPYYSFCIWRSIHTMEKKWRRKERRKHHKSMAITISLLPFIQMALSIQWISVIFTHTHTHTKWNIWIHGNSSMKPEMIEFTGKRAQYLHISSICACWLCRLSCTLFSPSLFSLPVSPPCVRNWSRFKTLLKRCRSDFFHASSVCIVVFVKKFIASCCLLLTVKRLEFLSSLACE